jgi:hypothetical protein
MKANAATQKQREAFLVGLGKLLALLLNGSNPFLLP